MKRLIAFTTLGVEIILALCLILRTLEPTLDDIRRRAPQLWFAGTDGKVWYVVRPRGKAIKLISNPVAMKSWIESTLAAEGSYPSGVAIIMNCDRSDVATNLAQERPGSITIGRWILMGDPSILEALRRS